MALITISGQTGCRHEEVARLAAQRLGFELITASRLAGLVAEQFGEGAAIPDKAYGDVVVSIVAQLAVRHHLVVSAEGGEFLSRGFPGALRVQVVGPESRRIGLLMLERRLDRPAAKQLLRELESEQKGARKSRFGMAYPPAHAFDLVLNAESLDPEHMAELIAAAVQAKGLCEQGLLSAAAEAQVQFQVRLRLSKHGISPPGKASLERKLFSHSSEEMFANLLDFYRIAWEYEPRSFPIQWDTDGRVLESFTPDFYLPEFDLFVELTTMKQSLVTKKNRKVKLLRSIYPHINIQVFYQKDLQNLIFKYGLSERPAR